MSSLQFVGLFIISDGNVPEKENVRGDDSRCTGRRIETMLSPVKIRFVCVDMNFTTPSRCGKGDWMII